MINDQFSPEEQAIIQQIQVVPKLELESTARASIRERMLSEFRVLSQQSITHAASQTRFVALTVTGLIVITIIVIVVLAIITSRSTDLQTATPTLMTLAASPQASIIATQPISQTTVSPDVPTQTRTPEASQTALATLESVDVRATTRVPPTQAGTAVPQISPSATQSATATTAPASLPSATPAPTLETIIVIEGPVANIVNNIITIYNFEVEVEVNHPILNLIEIGDFIRIEGISGSDDVIVAHVVSNLSSTPLTTGATVSLDGPVESINGNTIIVNGIPVQLAANDPLLQTVRVGQFVSVQGNFQGSGSTIVLVVVSIVANTNVAVTENDCWYHNDGMGMGHWHCDGMGMGMGDGGMGMGDDGMGMGMEGG